jgi:hypothetical protein
LGDWHDVEGWQGTFDDFVHDSSSNDGGGMCEGKKTWWVARADLGTGPFRWVIYQMPGGKLLASSKPFYLPNAIDETVRVEVSLLP